MANNDINRAFRDLLRSGGDDTPDFAYRVRVLVGYLVEAIDALNFYSAKVPDVAQFLRRLPTEAQQRLKIVRGTLQRAGPKALAAVRDNTFDYPPPDPASKPTSDKKLRDALAALRHIGVQMHYDGDTNALTFNFADEAAFNLAMGEPTTSNEEAMRRAARGRHLAAHGPDVVDVNSTTVGRPCSRATVRPGGGAAERRSVANAIASRNAGPRGKRSSARTTAGAGMQPRQVEPDLRLEYA